MSYDLFEQGPGVYMPAIIASLVITVVVYALFPLLFAKIRRKKITVKKYTIICFCVNIFIRVVFFTPLLDNPGSSVFPCFLWTSVFAALGKKILNRKGVLQIDEAAGIQESEATEILADNTHERESSKRNFKLPAPRIFAMIATILAVAVLVVCIIQLGQYRHEISDLKGRISDLESSQVAHDQTVEQLQEQIDERDAEIRLLNQAKNRMSDKISEMESEIDFYDRYVVFVRDDNTDWYHKYDCMIFQNSYASFWAYNIDAAISEGFEPCFYCID